MIWGIVCDVAGEPQAGTGEAFPPGFEYRWAEGGREAVRVSGPQYIRKVLTWVETLLNDASIFPTVEGTALKFAWTAINLVISIVYLTFMIGAPFPNNFEKVVSSVFTKLFRVYAIIYTNYTGQIESVGASAHLNTSFKHFLLFVWEFGLVKVQEMEAVAEVVREVQSSRCK